MVCFGCALGWVVCQIYEWVVCLWICLELVVWFGCWMFGVGGVCLFVVSFGLVFGVGFVIVLILLCFCDGLVLLVLCCFVSGRV